MRCPRAIEICGFPGLKGETWGTQLVRMLSGPDVPEGDIFGLPPSLFACCQVPTFWRVTFLVSHPFRRKKRKGWGTQRCCWAALPGMNHFEGFLRGGDGCCRLLIAVGGAQKGCFELRGRQPDTLIHHGAVEAAEGDDV